MLDVLPELPQQLPDTLTLVLLVLLALLQLVSQVLTMRRVGRIDQSLRPPATPPATPTVPPGRLAICKCGHARSAHVQSESDQRIGCAVCECERYELA